MKLAEAKKLKVGSVVCDCRYRHLEIASILPHRPGGKDGKVTDFDLVLKDGSHCSAVHCCSDKNHRWKHPSKAEQARLLKQAGIEPR